MNYFQVGDINVPQSYTVTDHRGDCVYVFSDDWFHFETYKEAAIEEIKEQPFFK